LGLLIFEVTSEWFFWDEFSARFNFIAVDYLIYTTEVIGNIRESYPMPLILGVIAAATLFVTWLVRRPLGRSLERSRSGGSPGWLLAALVILPVVQVATLDAEPAKGNRYAQELAKNGMASFVGAFRANTLDYQEYYRTMPESEAFARARSILARDGGAYLQPDPAENVERSITATGPEQRHNVILVTIESLSADFLGVFGNDKGLTPNLDRLANESLNFRRLFATGTRTVRGLESLSLSVPPTPGRSIVKRPDCGDLSTIGSILAAKGYSTHFIYGGYGYFDNMNAYFAANGYAITDRADMAKENISFGNVWGVCDEDLYGEVLRKADETVATGKPFFAHVMTTSNHRPYTYPNVVSIPSGTGRDGAVQYTDYAIGRFLEAARAKPWFDNTIFVFIADHCSTSAGKTEIALSKYHIPGFLYAPGLIEPETVEGLSSMVDFPPTILGLLNMSYESRFYGRDLRKPGRPLVMLGNYQTLGLMTEDSLVLLRPQQVVEKYAIAPDLQLTEQP
ncbi:MAG TPA: LTA synthase family protein, partial [Planctomycetota bacterium]|nr:LTA synthase family protein [Planctomycetota bacterium]